MAFDYYCTGCGKSINQSTALFDMSPIISGDDGLRILKFRLTQDQLLKMYNEGTAMEDGYKKCKLPLYVLMEIISGNYNLDDPAVAGLTMDDIDRFLAYHGSSFDFDDEEEDSDAGDFLGLGKQTKPKKTQQQENPIDYSMPASIEALIKTSEKLQAAELDEALVAEDLKKLKTLYQNDALAYYEVRPDYEKDSKGEDVLLGYYLISNGTRRRVRARFCPHCGERVFEFAGTARHQVYVFIGYRSAAKTSTILALTHYAAQNSMTNYGDVWKDSLDLSGEVPEVTLQNPSARLIHDLENYCNGVAPMHTEAHRREDAYSSTLRIKNKRGEYHLLTLIDLPGELFGQDGTVDQAKLFNQFPVAVSCDGYIACFNTAEAGNDLGMAKNVCLWTDQLQRLRTDQTKTAEYVPTLLLFTKCEDLEQGIPTPPESGSFVAPEKRAYMFYNEKRYIENGNRVYRFVCDQLEELGGLKESYYAMTRCSPYGYPAPDEVSDYEIQKPNPLNVDQMMKWLLSVSGCIAPKATLQMLSGNRASSDDYLIERPQKRKENPLGFQEALCRVYLFNNPGQYDVEWMDAYGKKSAEIALKAKMKLHSDSNHK